MSDSHSEAVGPLLTRLRTLSADTERAWDAAVEGRSRSTPEAVGVTLVLPTDAATPAALTLYDVDRELRRAVRLIQSDFEPKKPARSVAVAFPPLPVSEGHLAITGTAKGSLEIAFVAFGALAHALLSDPVQLAITTRELLGWTGKLIVAVRRPFEQDERIVYSTDDGVDLTVGPGTVQVGSLPSGARVRIDHTFQDGTRTRIEMDRS